MKSIDDAVEELYRFKPEKTTRGDFKEFWDNTLATSSSCELNSEVKQIPYPIDMVKVFEISYDGYESTRVFGYFIVPTFTNGKVPCLIHYHGYGGNKGVPSDFMKYLIMGISVLTIDVREQSGLTGSHNIRTGTAVAGVISKGILNKYDYYLRGAYVDSIRAVDFAVQREEVDCSKIIIEGGSQGGGLGMAVCCLDSRPLLALVDVPSFSCMEKRLWGGNGSIGDLQQVVRLYPDKTDAILETLSYFDTMNMADNIKCKVLASVGLKDDVCPALHYFATYNRIKTNKKIKIYPFSGHEGGGQIQEEEKLIFLKENL